MLGWVELWLSWGFDNELFFKKPALTIMFGPRLRIPVMQQGFHGGETKYLCQTQINEVRSWCVDVVVELGLWQIYSWYENIFYPAEPYQPNQTKPNKKMGVFAPSSS